jgi:hypothetical protein
MVRLRHICAQTRGGGEGDCPGGPSQTPRIRNDGPEAQLCFRVQVHVREPWRDRPDLLDSTHRHCLCDIPYGELRQPHMHACIMQT